MSCDHAARPLAWKAAYVRVDDVDTAMPVAVRVRVARTFWARLRGLSGIPALLPGEGLLLVPCRAVSSRGMRFALDVIGLAKDGTVVSVHRDFRRGDRALWCRGAHAMLELPMGTTAGVEVGHRLNLLAAE